MAGKRALEDIEVLAQVAYRAWNKRKARTCSFNFIVDLELILNKKGHMNAVYQKDLILGYEELGLEFLELGLIGKLDFFDLGCQRVGVGSRSLSEGF